MLYIFYEQEYVQPVKPVQYVQSAPSTTLSGGFSSFNKDTSLFRVETPQGIKDLYFK
jgi:hypothetical protein